MVTKEQYLHRPDDIKLPKIWEEMRQNQRELSWPSYWMNCQMANAYGTSGLWGNVRMLAGDSNTLGLGLGF